MSDRVNPGTMDRYLVAQVKEGSKTLKGGISSTWTDAFGFFASSSDEVVSESFSAIAVIAPVTIEFTTHYRSDLTRSHRIKDENGDFWQVKTLSKSGMTSMKIGCERMDE